MKATLQGFFAGGRKWRGFLVLVALVMALIMGGWITEQNIMRDLVLGLFAVLGAATAAEKFSSGKGKPSEVKEGGAP